jgi:hypothetical protein
MENSKDKGLGSGGEVGDRPVTTPAPVDDAGPGGYLVGDFLTPGEGVFSSGDVPPMVVGKIEFAPDYKPGKVTWVSDVDTALIAYQYAIEKERERCARVIEGEGSFFVGESPKDRAAAAKELANIIRSGK